MWYAGYTAYPGGNYLVRSLRWYQYYSSNFMFKNQAQTTRQNSKPAVSATNTISTSTMMAAITRSSSTTLRTGPIHAEL
jgi:hypothetical protein